MRDLPWTLTLAVPLALLGAAGALARPAVGETARSGDQPAPPERTRGPVAWDQGAAAAPVPGVAFHAVGAPTGPDLEGVVLEAFEPRRPSVAAVRASRAQRMNQAQVAIPDNVQASRSGSIEGASRAVTDFSEVHLARDPQDPDHLLGSSKFFHTPTQYGFYTGVFESFDGGRTWHQEQPPGVESYALTSDPVNTFDAVGNGYFTLLTRRGGGYSGVDMMKKPRGGDWELPVVVDSTTLTDKQWIAGDQDPRGRSPHAGNLYMSWTAFGGGASIVLSRSTDGNQSWSPLVTLAAGNIQGSVPAVGPDGTVYVLWGRDVFGGPAAGRLEMRASFDGGVSFGSVSTVAEITSIPFFLPNGLPDRNFRSPGSLPALAVSPASGDLYAAWADYRNGDADIYVARSTAGPDAWGPPVRVNDDPVANGVDQFHPQLAVAPNGRVALMWMDRRLPCPEDAWIPEAHRGRENFCITTYLARSYDGGATWAPNLQVGAEPWDWSVNLPIVSRDNEGFATGFIGDYQGLASSNSHDYPFWAATTDLGANPDHSQEAFVALVEADNDYMGGLPTPTGVTPTATPTPTLAPTGTTPTATPDPPTPTNEPTSMAPTSTPTVRASTTPTVTPSAFPTPTPPPSGQVCDLVVGRVPAAAIAEALANPEDVYGYGLRCNPNIPAGPHNPVRARLSLRNVAQSYHPLFNRLVWSCGCS